MKKILLISDTHGYIGDEIIKHINWSDEVWHAGDIGNLELCEKIKKHTILRAVYGNIDNHIIRKEYPEFDVFECENIKILMIHIGGYPGRYTKKAINLIKKHSPDLFICGHSHILKVLKDRKFNLIHINPGAIGKHGFHKVRTMISLEVERDEISNMNVIEYQK